MNIIKLILLIIFCFGIGYFSNYFFSNYFLKKKMIFKLDKKVELYYNNKKIGELYEGAELIYQGGSSEGFQSAILIMNYYEKPEAEQYYKYIKTNKSNLKNPCWNSEDVSLE